MIPRYIIPTTFVIALMLLGDSADSMADEQFLQKVAPIFQRRCLSCHNDVRQKGEFSLQTSGSAMKDGHIEPGKSRSSYLVELITPTKGNSEMPKDSDPLSPDEIEVIRKWIDAGAKWPREFRLEEPKVTDFDWWSYRPMKRPPVPDQTDPWIRNPVDAFVLKKQVERGLSRGPQADRRTLIRRVTYDLIGLPPTPGEVQSFIEDQDPLAYEKLVERLLASKHYGERWARHWLDVVKYADTCGYDKDKLRVNAWPYRDYVIRSLNQDKPYARFVREQIAGDVLFPGEPDGILGLGFIAAGPWDFIGHVEVPESKIDGKVARNLDRDDMVSNTINTFCSITIQCARCHNHKFDPITQEHYYSMQSIFAAVDRADRFYDLDAESQQQRRTLESKLVSLKADMESFKQEIAEAGGERLSKLSEQIKKLKQRQKTEKEPEFGYHSAIAKSSETEKWVAVDLGKLVDISRIVLRPCHDDFAGIGAGFGFPVRFQVEVSAESGKWVTVSDQTTQDYPNPGLSPFEIDRIGSKAQHVRITATRLAKRSNDYIFALAELQVFDDTDANVALGCKVTSRDSIEAPVRWSRKNLTDQKWAQARDPKLAQQLEAAVEQHATMLAKIETTSRIERRRSIQQSLKQVQDKLSKLPQGKMVFAAATHFKPEGNFKPTKGKLRAVHLLHRGNIQQPRTPATPGVFPLRADSNWRFDPQMNESQRRAELARRLTDKDHPLLWRSIVNRVWQYHFGQGIVATPNDFGRMGAAPTHPELLDWLAMEFRDGGQSLKQLHRTIVSSAVYRQSSHLNKANALIDGSNHYLWRMNRRRLEAEEIRDSILAVSGSLDVTMGGSGFYLFKLEKTTHSPHYEYHKFNPADPKSHRRSIYRFIVRSQPDPWMTTLDCADSSQSTPKRNETLTSLQALSLLNNRFNIVMAERFANRLKKEEDGLSKQVERAIMLVAQRPANHSERVDMEAYAEKHGLANLCRLLFNLSEFVYLD